MDPFKRIEELELQLDAAHEEIAKLGVDCVSGLLTRGGFEKHLEGRFRSNRRNESPMGIIMCDIDLFKEVNDTHGHRVGDDVITRVATTIQACTRTTDIVARYGGEEFVCILVNADHAGLALLSERIRRMIENISVPGLPKVTVSVGFALQNETDASGWDIVERADKALYGAKANGRNRVEHSTLGDSEVKMICEIERVRPKE